MTGRQRQSGVLVALGGGFAFGWAFFEKNCVAILPSSSNFKNLALTWVC